MAGSRRRALWAAAATLAVATGIVAGLILLGSPGERRLHRIDDRRVQRLRRLASEIETYREKEGRLPAELAALAAEPWATPVARDPETHEPFVYEPLAPDRYRLCAEFARPSPAPRPDVEEDFWTHPEGRHCYEIEVEGEGEPGAGPDEPPSEGIPEPTAES